MASAAAAAWRKRVAKGMAWHEEKKKCNEVNMAMKKVTYRLSAANLGASQ
jgi:hypothetical protein